MSGGVAGLPNDASSRPEGIGKALSDPAAFNAKMRLFWIGCGREDGGFARAKEAHEALEKGGVTHGWFEVPGGHEWQVWRKSLHNLAQKLFREK